MDVGLIISALAAIAAAEALALARPGVAMPDGPTDAGLAAVAAGVVGGRLVALALDDPSSLFALRDVAALRGGVEFWPGVAIGLLVVALAAARRGVPVSVRVADVAPFGLVAVAGYQATCFVREGCFGPPLPPVLAPGATHPPDFAVEVAGAMALVGLALVLSAPRWRTRPGLVVVVAVWGLAFERAVVSFWLPVVGDGLSRPHRQSIAVTVLGATSLLGWAARERRRGASVRHVVQP